MEKKQDKTRITIDLTQSQYKRLERVEENSGAASKADVVREALRLYEFLLKRRLEGYEFSMKRKGESPKDIVLLSVEQD
jgi:Arc/MetJ-type ribon-helix-helix transcriptional regulator